MASDNPKSPNVGALIERTLAKKGMTRSQLARNMGYSPQAIGSIMNQPSIRMAKLWEVSLAMGHDFYSDLSAMLPENVKPSPENPTQKRIAELEQQIRDLQKEVEIYGKALGIKKD